MSSDLTQDFLPLRYFLLLCNNRHTAPNVTKIVDATNLQLYFKNISYCTFSKKENQYAGSVPDLRFILLVLAEFWL